ncbi:hypothetical protein BESB_040110 [Besnoitia besnoiti]|uniref:Non-structural maintenance of chromosomes element 1 homolog n=1 Tax=Besnoitia besnoiti TaxID=94643 RepID=A0A2A9MNN2_BESBE|nr:hypothetical protein BESB_040110 [Besnoitia besnoiti]PFH37553.1 hypothetical protein BESB_040110 [Besnoitia besnoiti]
MESQDASQDRGASERGGRGDRGALPPREACLAFVQHLLFFRVMRWHDAEALQRQLHVAFALGEPQPLNEFVADVAEVLHPTGLRIRKIFCDGSDADNAYVVLRSEAEEELPENVSLLRVFTRLSRRFSPAHVQVFEAVATHLLRTRRPMSLLKWTRVCQTKNASPAPVLRTLLDLQLLQIETDAAQVELSQPRLVLGPWCYADKLRSLEAFISEDEWGDLACTRCRLPAVFNAFRCGASTCKAQFHKECLLRRPPQPSPLREEARETGGALAKTETPGDGDSDAAEAESCAERRAGCSSRRKGGEDSSATAEALPDVCPTCKGPWRHVRVVGETGEGTDPRPNEAEGAEGEYREVDGSKGDGGGGGSGGGAGSAKSEERPTRGRRGAREDEDEEF